MRFTGYCSIVFGLHSLLMPSVEAFTSIQPTQHQHQHNQLSRRPPRQQQQKTKQTFDATTCSPTILSRSTLILNGVPDELMYSDGFSVPILLAAALGVGIAAQTFINQMLKGEQGLGAFLTDGGGFNKSGFRPTKDKDVKTDPMPWLKLPQLDFVDVAGQEKITNETELMVKLERLRNGMKLAVDQGKVREAESLRKELEQTMERYGVEFTSDQAFDEV